MSNPYIDCVTLFCLIAPFYVIYQMRSQISQSLFDNCMVSNKRGRILTISLELQVCSSSLEWEPWVVGIYWARNKDCSSMMEELLPNPPFYEKGRGAFCDVVGYLTREEWQKFLEVEKGHEERFEKLSGLILLYRHLYLDSFITTTKGLFWDVRFRLIGGFSSFCMA